jgi:hypothetical protein
MARVELTFIRLCGYQQLLIVDTNNLTDEIHNFLEQLISTITTVVVDMYNSSELLIHPQ